MISQRRRTQQRGSALLIVLVMAAMIAIMLYREMPVSAFEAQRQKEQLLMDRGKEYSRAVQLYVRKFQTFPPSIEALENTNRMRFLRNRYVDPYSGKDDWRFLHAGPGGTILDSKIKQTAGPNATAVAGANGSTGSSSSPLGQGSSVTNPFANSFDGANAFPTAPAAPGLPQRPPAMPTAAAGGGGNADMTAGMPQDPSNPAAPVPYPGYPGPMADPSQNTGSSGPVPAGVGRFRGFNPNGNSYPSGAAAASDGSTPPASGPQDPQAIMQQLLNNQNPQPAVQNTANGNGVVANAGMFSSNNNNNSNANGSTNGTTQMGSMNGTAGGAIAGVASKTSGKTIKVYNDQKDRSLWEFVYDMQKEAMANASGAGLPGTGNSSNTNNNGNNNSNGSPATSSFGQNNNVGNTLSAFPTPTQPAQSANQ